MLNEFTAQRLSEGFTIIDTNTGTVKEGNPKELELLLKEIENEN